MRTLITSDAVVSGAGTLGNALATENGTVVAIGKRSDIERSGDRIVGFDGAFVSDHIETLYEIDLLYGERAAALGITGYRRTESLNDSPAFLAALADMVEEALA